MAISMESFASAGEILELHPGEFIFKEGTTSNGIYHLLSGAVAMTIELPIKPTRTSDADYLFEIATPGDFLGIRFRDLEYGASACALNSVRVMRIPIDEFQKFWMITPLFIQKLVLQAEDRFQQMMEMSKVNYLASVQERIANTIRILAQRFGDSLENGEVQINLHLSRRELAQLSGTIDESVARHIGDLKRSGVIREERKHLIVCDMAELTRLIPPAAGFASVAPMQANYKKRSELSAIRI